MKRIKGFKLFESKSEVDIDAVCSLYEDVKSIEYILEEGDIYPQYKLSVVCTPEGTLQKEIRSIRVSSCGDIREVLMRPGYILRDFYVYIENLKGDHSRFSSLNKIMGEESFKREVDKYYNLLREHLDYVTGGMVSIKGFRPPQNYHVIISGDFFNI